MYTWINQDFLKLLLWNRAVVRVKFFYEYPWKAYGVSSPDLKIREEKIEEKRPAIIGQSHFSYCTYSGLAFTVLFFQRGGLFPSTFEKKKKKNYEQDKIFMGIYVL